MKEQFCLFNQEEMNSLLDFKKGKERLYISGELNPNLNYYKIFSFDCSEDMNIIRDYWNEKDFGKN